MHMRHIEVTANRVIGRGKRFKKKKVPGETARDLPERFSSC